MISLDTETTGVDFYHGARPFFVTTCAEGGRQRWWQWDVDPLTRVVGIPQEDIDEIAEAVSAADGFVAQNGKFDCAALREAGMDCWPWGKAEDTLIAAHLLASNRPHDLTSLALQYLGVDIEPYEKRLEQAVKKARDYCRRHLPEWAIAKVGRADMPSAKEKTWKYDTWLPRALVQHGEAKNIEADTDTWGWVLQEYANVDSTVTLAVWGQMKRELHRRGLWEIYRERMKAIPIAVGMEQRGVTLSGARLEKLRTEYADESARCNAVCVSLAASLGYELTMPEGSGTNNSLRHFASRVLTQHGGNWPKTDTGQIGLNKAALELYCQDLPAGSREQLFFRRLRDKRKRDTAITYMDSYMRFWLPLGDCNDRPREISTEGCQDERVLEVARQQVSGEGLRPVQDGRGEPGTQSQLSAVHRPNSKGDVSATQMRQSGMRPAGPSVSRHQQGQLGGHGSQGPAGRGGQQRGQTVPGKVGSRGTTSHDISHRGTGSGDKKALRSGESDIRRGCSSQEVRYDKAPGITLGARSNLETFDLTEWFVLHPQLNPTGTGTLRWSSNNPNEQNISKQEGFNLRYAFGPAPGREWWSFDAKNIELRLPAYESGEQDMIALFERPDDPPYYGSNHLLNFSAVYPDLWADAVKEVGLDKAGPYCKKRYASTWYQWCKNGGFAVLYGAVDREGGTADRAFHKVGAHSLLRKRFRKMEDLNQKWIRFARDHGCVETMPDRTVNPRRGYPLLCTRTDFGDILPTVPLNYHIQSTAMWWTMKAMIRVACTLDEWREERGFDGYLVMQVHDEIVLDFPAAAHPLEDPDNSNLWAARVVQQQMARGGDDLVPAVPTPVGCEFHPDNWGEGVTV